MLPKCLKLLKNKKRDVDMIGCEVFVGNIKQQLSFQSSRQSPCALLLWHSWPEVFVPDTKSKLSLFVGSPYLFMRVRDKEWCCFCLFIVATCVCEKRQCVPEGIPAVTGPGLKHS